MIKQSSQKLLAEVESKRRSKEELARVKPEELGAAVGGLQSEIKELESHQSALNARAEDVKQSIQELSEAEAQCPVCERPLEEEKKHELLEKKRAQQEDLAERATEIGGRLKKLREDLAGKLELQRRALLLSRDAEELPAKEAEHSKLLDQVHAIEDGLPDLRAASERLEKENERCRAETENSRAALTQAQQRLEFRVDLDRQESNKKQRLEEGLQVKEELERARTSYDPAEVKKAGERREELLQRCSGRDAQVRGTSQLIIEKENFVRALRDKLDDIRYGETKAKHFKEAAQALVTIQTAVARTQIAMRQMFMDGVNEVLGDFWDDIYPYGDYIGVKLAVEGDEKGGDYVLQLRDRNGNWIPVDGMASGGERTDACLALRIAFSIVLAPDLKWIVFDEPTHNLDTEGIQELARAMRERLPQIVRQILLITHEERLEGAVSGYLYRFYRDKANDEPTRVEKVSVPELVE
jgi:exonuclease SbcC